MQLFELLGLFERCSGLKINESKSELLWLGSWRHRKDKILNLQISEEPVYALGVHFAYEGSRSLTEVEIHYSQTEREALGIVWACERLHTNLYGTDFEIDQR